MGLTMVAEGIYYAIALAAGGGLVGYIAHPVYGVPMFLVAAFCLYFFRDPDRVIPPGPVVVSPADGRVVAIRQESAETTRISVFLNIFDVHVNRAPSAGAITDATYRRGRFLVASREGASSQNEQNSITVEGELGRVVFKQIAGLIARRIVFHKRVGDTVRAGDRVGMIKFGSRVDVHLGREWDILVSEGMRVTAGSSVLARLRAAPREG
jgi:phosphatidylserine decarboxylase